MNQLIKIFSFIVLAFAVACAGTGQTTGSSNSDEDSLVLVKNLPLHIDTLPRLSVSGTGANARVINTSSSSIRGSNAPLFVLDGVTVGRNLGRVMQLLDQNQRVAVDFLSTRRATIRYGEDGKNGVILIKTQ
ncbi:MAG: hypothetical protein U5J95_10135 [Balneolaceae bacterium]|nr:hypothetical protein [Balneolaceae bacterium]